MKTFKSYLLVMASSLILPCRVHAGDPSTGLISVPIRWCAVEGSAAASGMSAAPDNQLPTGNDTTDLLLWRRHERVTDTIFGPQAGITFRSGFTRPSGVDVTSMFHFPIIKDPRPSGPGSALKGDIVYQQGDTELNDALTDCDQRWKNDPNDPMKKGHGISVGIVGLAVGHLVDTSGNPAFGNPTTSTGQASIWPYANLGMCLGLPVGTPPNGQMNSSGKSLFVAVGDASGDRVLAHELGHALFLGHGDGEDNDVPADTVFDENCDGLDPPSGFGHNFSPPPEDPNSGDSLMKSFSNSTMITTRQKNAARAVARVTDGGQADPPGTLINLDTVGDHITDPAHDAPADIDLTSVGMDVNTVAQLTNISHVLFGTIPLRVTNQYVVFADLDGNPATGGSPASLGFTTSFQGAELITRVVVTFGGDPEFLSRIVIPTVWKFQTGTFTPIADPQIRAAVGTSILPDTGIPLMDSVVLTLPNTITDGAQNRIRLQAIAQQLQPGGQLDRLPDTSTDGAGDLSLIPPRYPECTVAPAPVAPGVATTVDANGLLANNTAKVLLGDEMVATGPIDGAGNARIDFAVPSSSGQGTRLVTVGVMGTALTADCGLEVAGATVASIPVPLDIKPKSCPNPINLNAKGTFPVAILGTSSFDVTKIDTSLIRLEGVSPLRSLIQDVATPFSPFIGKTGANACTTAGPDGFTDLSLSFDATQIASTLGPVTNGQVVTLHLTGNFLPQFGGGPIVGEDVVVIKTK